MKKTSNTATKKPFYKKWWFITIMVVVILYAIGSTGDDAPNSTETPSTVDETEIVAKPLKKTDDPKTVIHSKDPTDEKETSQVDKKEQNSTEETTKYNNSEEDAFDENIKTEAAPSVIEPPAVEPPAVEPPAVETPAVETPTVEETNTESQENIVYIGQTGNRYHYEDCHTLKGNGIPITLDEAISQGRSACGWCH